MNEDAAIMVGLKSNQNSYILQTHTHTHKVGVLNKTIDTIAQNASKEYINHLLSQEEKE